MVSKTKHSIIFILFILLSSCKASAENSLTCSSLVSNIQSDGINTDLIISTPNGKSNYTVKDDLVFLADNYSSEVLQLAPDKDFEVYLQDDSGWSQLKNNLDYLSRVEHISVKSPDDPGRQIYNFFYDTSLIKEPTNFCIILRAVKDPKNTQVPVVSYIEIKVNP